MRLIFAITLLVTVMSGTANASTQQTGELPSDALRLFPATYGRFAPGGDCRRLPRVTLNSEAIKIETISANASFVNPNVVTNYGGPQDESITYQLQGPGEGLHLNVSGDKLMTFGGEHLGEAERALSTIADVNATPLARCKH